MEAPKATSKQEQPILCFGSPNILIDPEFELSNQSAEATTNVLLIKFGHLANEARPTTGDAVSCSNCQAILSSLSSLQEDTANTKNDEQQQIWTCEFCGTKNKITLEPEERPRSEPLEYLTGRVPQEKESTSDNDADDSILIFVMDTSGSMSHTTLLEGENAYLQQLQEKNNKSVNSGRQAKSALKKNESRWVSRLEFAQGAVDSQLEAMKKESPKRRVGLITFSSSVVVYDDKGSSIEISGDVLDDYSALMEKGSSFHLEQSICDTRETLGTIVRGLNDGGMTALGPALVLSVAIASQRTGSKCIICTDGLANVGVGSLEAEGAASSDFYEQIAQFAKRKGVTISVISIKGTETKLEKLGALADITRGSVDLVDPQNLNFGNLLSNTLATNCIITLYLHKSLQLLHEEKNKNDAQQGTTSGSRKRGKKEAKSYTRITRDVGNVTQDTQICFEFDPKPPATGTGKKRGKPLKQVPFQVQFAYNKLNGAEYKRVYTCIKPVVTERALAQQNCDICVISANLAQQSARMARAGLYEEALANATRVRDMLAKQIKTEEQRGLWNIFMAEFREINKELGNEITKEAGTPMSAIDRSEARTDCTAHKLYSYQAAKSEACLLQ